MIRSVRWLAGYASAVTIVMSAAAMAEEAATGIISKTGTETVVSAHGMTPGGGIWAVIRSVGPKGKVVSAGTNKQKGASLELVLEGASIAYTEPPKGFCRFIGRDGPIEPSGLELKTSKFDAYACSYWAEAPWREENPDDTNFRKAGLYVAEFPQPGDIDIDVEYAKTGTTTYYRGVEGDEFKNVQKALQEAGAMKLSIRWVAMSPGSRVVTLDRYPVFRFVEGGSVKWGVLPASANSTEDPKVTFNAKRDDWISWMNPGQIVLANMTDQTVEFIEFAVEPAPGQQP